ncbi:MAG: hypothetical protein L6R38_002800 [Xanthoria sp. 2 TBL-2021]|nr:MAG: hypothetical protein L6R38_002800 [Xanthoria sp. 2 TBL-2021]
MAIVSHVSDTHKGAAGRPFLTTRIETTLANMAPPTPLTAPKLQLNGLSSISESANSSPITPASNDRTALKLNMYRTIRPPPFRHAWSFYHEKSSFTADASAAYEDRLTTLLESIITIKTFWECFNQLPLQNLKTRDSIHFFKRGVQPVWEDPRNVHGGSWTFRVKNNLSEEFWKEVLMLAVGEQFSDAIQSGDDLCGLSFSRRFNSAHITIWNRRANFETSVNAIRDVVLAQLSDELKPKEGTYYYKAHSEHKGFDEAVAARKKEGEEDARMESAKVGDGEAESIMLKEAEAEGIQI